MTSPRHLATVVLLALILSACGVFAGPSCEDLPGEWQTALQAMVSDFDELEDLEGRPIEVFIEAYGAYEGDDQVSSAVVKLRDRHLQRFESLADDHAEIVEANSCDVDELVDGVRDLFGRGLLEADTPYGEYVISQLREEFFDGAEPST